MNSKLADKQCKPCQGGEKPLKGDALKHMQAQLGNGWEIVDEHHLKKAYAFKNFIDALAFTNRVGDIAEEQGHHPDIYLTWGKVELIVWTHKVDGLTENDFIFAAKADDALTPVS